MQAEMSNFFSACQVDAASPEAGPEAPPGAGPPYRVTSICKSTEGSSWGKTDFVNTKDWSFVEGKDVKGPVSMAVSVEPKPMRPPGMPGMPDEKAEGPRMVVFGSILFAVNDGLAGAPGNLDLILNSVSWLAGKETQMGIAPKPLDLPRLIIGDQARNVIFAIALVLMPVFGIIAGVVVWFVRRK
jgi:ABC-type uncharacterized transport system involved in gliding motility auxiliary subunit